jgi:hypothetical protein
MCNLIAVQDLAGRGASSYVLDVDMTMMPPPELYQGQPLQLDFSGTAPRITTGTATPVKQKVCRFCKSARICNCQGCIIVVKL